MKIDNLSLSDLYAIRDEFNGRWTSCMERKSFQQAERLLKYIEIINVEIETRLTNIFEQP